MKFVKGKLREWAIESGTYKTPRAGAMKHKKKEESKTSCRKFKGGNDNNDLL